MLLYTLGAAFAQDAPALNAQTFHASVDGRAGLSLDDAEVAPDHYVTGRAMVQYVHDPLVRWTEGGEEAIVSDLLAVDLLAAWTFARFRVGLDVPVYAVTAGSGIAGGALVGDVALDLKYGLLDPAVAAIGLAPVLRVSLPSAGDQAPVGSGGLGYEVGFAASRRLGPWMLAANLATRGVPEVELENVTWGPQLVARAGVGRALGDRAGANLELGVASVYEEFLVEPAGSPAELMLGGWLRADRDIVVRAGAGTALTRGIGAPDARVVVAVGWEPPHVRDADGDGITDRHDQCRERPEDFDAWRDEDGCPDPGTQVRVRVVDADGAPLETATVRFAGGEDPGAEFVVEAGRYPLVVEAEGYAHHVEEVDVPAGPPMELVRRLALLPRGGLLELRVSGPDLQPLAAAWRLDGGPAVRALDGTAKARVGAGDHAVRVEAAGYAPAVAPVAVREGETTVLAVVLQPAKVEVTREKIAIADKVYFDTAKATIRPESFPLLQEVAGAIQDHPEVRRVRIEGHTDSRGSDAFNLRLSDARAKSVREWLVRAGIDEARLEAAGFGETRPVDPAENAGAWEKNRRVEFMIVEREE